MSFILQPWHLMLLVMTGVARQDQQNTIDYLLAENQILRKKLGKKRIVLTDAERRRPAVKGKTLGRRLLEQLATIVTPDTILRWHRMTKRVRTICKIVLTRFQVYDGVF